MWTAEWISCPWCSSYSAPVPRGIVYICPGCRRYLEWPARTDAGWVVSTSMPVSGCPEPNLLDPASIVPVVRPAPPPEVALQFVAAPTDRKSELSDLLSSFGSFGSK